MYHLVVASYLNQASTFYIFWYNLLS